MLQRHEHLSAADAACLRMDAPANRMIITALLTFDGRLDPIAFEHTLHRLAELPLFKARVVPTRNPFGLPEWEDDPRFDLRAHVHHVALPSDPPTCLRRPLGLVKRVAWSRAIPFTQVHRLAREHRASMNDVVMAALAGARLASLMLWAPTSGRLGLSVTILGYAGEIRISVAADCSLPLEPEA